MFCNNSALPLLNLVCSLLKGALKYIAGAAEMPDAMEIIYQRALSVGKIGAVSELLLSAVKSHLKSL